MSDGGGATVVDIGSNGHEPTPGQQTIGGGEVQSVYVEQIRVDGTTQLAIDFGGKQAHTAKLTLGGSAEVDGFFRKGDRIRGTFEAVVVAVGAKDKIDKADGDPDGGGADAHGSHHGSHGRLTGGGAPVPPDTSRGGHGAAGGFHMLVLGPPPRRGFGERGYTSDLAGPDPAPRRSGCAATARTRSRRGCARCRRATSTASSWSATAGRATRGAGCSSAPAAAAGGSWRTTPACGPRGSSADRWIPVLRHRRIRSRVRARRYANCVVLRAGPVLPAGPREALARGPGPSRRARPCGRHRRRNGRGAGRTAGRLTRDSTSRWAGRWRGWKRGRTLPVPVPYVDVLCGGFPCQDISVAGRGEGIDGARSGLWGEYARLIRELRPRYVVVENVAALLARGMERVLGDLAACGYDAEWDCIPASAVGAPHRRDRVWLVAYPNGSGLRPGLADLHARQPDAQGRGADVGHAAGLEGHGRHDERPGERAAGPSGAQPRVMADADRFGAHGAGALHEGREEPADGRGGAVAYTGRDGDSTKAGRRRTCAIRSGSGSLNPTWVSKLMGFPADWLDL
jgi:site-specific DNA-cytosine methylase